MESTFGNINAVKYLDKDGFYNVKAPRGKEFKKYKYSIKKEDISVVNKKMINQCKNADKELNVDVAALKKIFVTMLASDPKSNKYKNMKKQKEKIIKDIHKTIDNLSGIELVKNSMGSIPPKDHRYTNRTIHF